MLIHPLLLQNMFENLSTSTKVNSLNNLEWGLWMAKVDIRNCMTYV